MNEEILNKRIKLLKGNILKYRVEIIIDENIINDILINIDFLKDNKNKTYIISFSEENLSSNFLYLFQNLILNLEDNNLKLQEFLLELQKLIKDVNDFVKIKKVFGSIIFEYNSNEIPNSYTFEGFIDGKSIYFVSPEINNDYFENMNYDLFIKKEY